MRSDSLSTRPENEQHGMKTGHTEPIRPLDIVSRER